MNFISSIKQISKLYDYFIFDVWGVIHDGNELYPQVIETLDFLRNQGKKICFLSNAPRRADMVANVLQNFGIDKKLYDFVLTSGEAAFLDLEKNQKNDFKDFGRNYFYIGPQKDINLLQGLDYIKTEEASKANFVITTGFDNDHSILEEKLPQMMEAKRFNLPMICVNPDLMVVRQNGNKMICAGVLAEEYKKVGGIVSYYGKPFTAVYKMVCEIFNSNQTNRMITIGDGIETDIKGANDFGIDSILITGGILSDSLGIKFWQDANQDHLKSICNSYQIFPKFIISNLKI